MKEVLLRRRLLATCAILSQAGVAANPLHAQSAAVNDAEVSRRVQEIVVTAERRTQNLQAAPLAVTARDGASLVAQGRTSLAQIIEDVPGVNFKPNTGAVAQSDTASASVSIRGIGSNDATSYTSVVPAVAQYVDGVVGGLGGDYDLERIEVLRGPQGTLYGRSATAGVLNIITRAPRTLAAGAEGGGEIGNYGLRRIWGAVNLPVTEQAALRISGQHFERDGYYSRGGDLSSESVRLKALIAPAEGVGLSLAGAYERNDFFSGGAQINVTPQGLDSSASAPVGKGRDVRKQVSAKLDFDLGFATLTYIPAYRTYDKRETSYSAFGDTLLSDTNDFSKDTFHTEEVRLTSPGGGRLSWQSGLFYYDNDIAVSYSLIAQGGLFPGAFALQDGSRTKRTRNLGVFAEGTYALSTTTRFTAGLRYDRTVLNIEEQDCSGPVGGPQSCLAVTGSQGRRAWNDTTFKVRLEHDIAPSHLVYGTISSAFLPGDVTVLTNSTGALAVLPYEPETLTSYEIGTKNRFLDGTLQINASAYYYEYGGYQQKIQIGDFMGVALNAIGNSPARVRGAEIEATARLSPLDRLDLSLAYIDAYYVDKPAAFAAAVAQRKIAGILPFQAIGAYSRDFNFGSQTVLTLKAEGNYRSGLDLASITPAQAASSAIRALVRQKPVLVGNLYASLRLSGNLSVNAYLRNIFDNRYKTLVTPNGISTRLPVRLFEPRTVGVVLNVRF